jgi:hypothetical protein
MAVPNDRMKKAVAEAEASVAAVKDPNLRVAAFEKVLQHLLAGAEESPRQSGSAPRSPRKTASPKSKPVSRAGPRGRIEEMVADGFFKKPRTLSDVKTELANRGFHIPRTSLSGPLQALCQKKMLRRQKGIAGDKDAFGYSNW